MSRQRGVYGKINRLSVSDLAYHYYVRILADQRPQPRCESKTYVRTNLRLIHARHPVFDRVFDRGNIYSGHVKYGQDRIERRCFSRARWTGSQDHADRFFYIFMQKFKRLPVKAEVLKPESFGVFRKEPHYDFFAVKYGKHRDPKGYIVFRSLDLESPILWQPVLIQF